jgi:hypothetical protein
VKPRRSKLRRTLVVLALASLGSFALAEFGLRIFVLRDYWRPLPPFRAINTPTQEAWLARQHFELAGERPPSGIGCIDAELGWSYRPGAVMGDGIYTIHARGWRGPRDYAALTPEGVTRLVAFGESFTFCHEVPDDASWEAQLEALEPRFELPNFGVGGYGTDQALLRAMRELPRLDADVVLIGILPENIGRNVTRYRPLWVPESETPAAKPRFVLRNGALELVPLPFRERAEYVRAVADGSVIALLAQHEYWNDQPVPAWLAWSASARLLLGRRAYARRDIGPLWTEGGEPFDVTLALLARFRELARAHGARDAVVLIFPARPDLRSFLATEEKYWTRLLDALTAQGAPFLDCTDALAEAARASAPARMYGPGHLSREGNAVVARRLRAWLTNWL